MVSHREMAREEMKVWQKTAKMEYISTRESEASSEQRSGRVESIIEDEAPRTPSLRAWA